MSIFSKVKKNQEENFSSLINKIDENNIDNLVNLLIKYSNNNIYFAGVGKSGNLALHLSDVFKSVGLKAFNLNIMNTTHGDLGCVKKDDLILFFSKSGNTKEMLDIIDVFDCFKVLVCSNVEAKISKKVDETFIVPMNEEGDIHFNLIPSNSIANNIIYFNFVLNLYIEKTGLTLDEYKCNHPSGDIGFKTKKVKDFLSNDILVSSNLNMTVREVMSLLENNKMGIVFEEIIKDDKIFYGILTTKDVLICANKLLVENNGYDSLIKDHINKKPFIIEDSNSLISSKIKSIKDYKYFKFIPVIDNNKYVGIIDNSKILKYL
jgi:arabinose-5-phosphate isomerase